MFRTLPEHCGFGLDNPDNVYSSAGINPAPDSSMILVRQTFADRVAPWRAEPNRLHFPDPEHHRLVGGDPNIVFQLGNIWAECLDKRRTISRNIASTTYEPDGSFRLVVAHTDPGHPNWIDTCGHRHGIMGLRWVCADTHPPAGTRVLPLASVA